MWQRPHSRWVPLYHRNNDFSFSRVNFNIYQYGGLLKDPFWWVSAFCFKKGTITLVLWITFVIRYTFWIVKYENTEMSLDPLPWYFSLRKSSFSFLNRWNTSIRTSSQKPAWHWPKFAWKKKSFFCLCCSFSLSALFSAHVWWSICSQLTLPLRKI